MGGGRLGNFGGISCNIKQFFTGFYKHLRLSFLGVALGMLFVYLIPYKIINGEVMWQVGQDYLSTEVWFHVFHYSHMTFACATCFMTFLAYSGRVWWSIVASIFLPLVFCTFSDILLPYWGGKLLGVQMDLHICIFCNQLIISIFLAIGLLIGLLCYQLSRARRKFLQQISLCTHFMHEFVSAIASIIYLVGFGFLSWHDHLVYVFILMIFAVVLPCMLSDFILPTLLAKLVDKDALADYDCPCGGE